jgi:hypothetical protein
VAWGREFIQTGLTTEVTATRTLNREERVRAFAIVTGLQYIRDIHYY